MEHRAKTSGSDLPPIHGMQAVRRLYRCMAGLRGPFYGMLVMLLLSLAAELTVPLLIESAVNAISFYDGAAVDFRALTVSLAALAALAVVSAVLGSLLERFSAKITLSMSMRIREELFQSLMDSSVSRFESMRKGDLMSRMLSDSELAAGAFTEGFRELLSAVIVVVGCAVIMFTKCVPLTAVSVGAALVSVFATGALSKLVLPAVTKQQAAHGWMNAHAEETLKAFRSCVAGGRLKENKKRMRELSTSYYTAALRARRLEYMMGPVMLVFGNLGFLLTVVFGVRQIIAGAITVGTMQAFVMYSRQFTEPLNTLGENLVKLQKALAGAERVFSVIDGKDERTEIAEAAPADAQAEESGDAVSFENIAFAYHRNRPVLRGVNLHLKKGERMALVGRTGEGKTTLCHLLELFYPAYTGRIFLDGQEIRTLPPEQVRGEIALVSQEPQIVEGTVYDNLTYGCGELGRDQVERVLRDMGIDRFLARLPRGLDTEMTSLEEQISQGQLQLICLARAVLRDAAVLILDEAVSSLDPDTEAVVQQGMETAMRGRTCIIIAHRLSSIREADRIAVLDGGVIAEYGTHTSLMERGGLYRSLYQLQFMGEEI